MRHLTILIAGLACMAGPAASQDPAATQVTVEKLAPGVAVLFGSGGNIGLSYGVDGNAIIDDQFAPLTPKILTAIATLDTDPVRFVINTHWHYDHTGGNENFGRSGSVIIAQRNVRTRMAAGQVMAALKTTVPPAPSIALPVLTFDDGVTLHLNGDTIEVSHVLNAHTDGDSLVYWKGANVLHMGDTFFFKISFPFIDLESGGSIDGAIAAAGRGLEIANPATRIIPGHGPVATRADLVAYRAMLIDIRARVAAGIKAKRTLEQIKASAPAARYGMPDGFIPPDRFVETVYNSLKHAPAPPSHNIREHDVH